MAALLAGKSAAITGGVTGIGRAIALGYLRHGAAVTVNFLDDAPSRKHFESLKAEAPTGSKLHGVTGDIGLKATGEEIVKEAVDAHGSLEIFVANAGVSQFRDFVTWVCKSDPSESMI
jgi:L-rhamnose 1-dehydrogenase